MPAITKSLVTLQSLSRAPKPVLGTRHFKALLRLASLARQHRHLGELPDHLLKDVGIATDAPGVKAQWEIWHVPDHLRWPALSGERDAGKGRRQRTGDYGARLLTHVRDIPPRDYLEKGPRHG